MNWLKKTWKTLTVTEKVVFAAVLLFLGLILSATSAQADHSYRHYVASTVHQMIDAGMSCSAVMIAPERAMTAAHCTGTESPALMVNGVKYPITEAYANPDRDLAVLIVPGAPCPCAVVGIDAPLEGAWVAAVGYPHGVMRVVTYGEVQGRMVSPDDQKEYVIATTLAAPGSSGSGLFDADGYLIGILSGGIYGERYLAMYTELLSVALTIPTK